MKKKFLMVLMSAMMVTGNMSMVNAAEYENETNMEAEYIEAEPRGVDRNGNYSLSVGQSFEESFKVGNFIKEDHNTFNVKVEVDSGATATLIVTITSKDGFYHTQKVTSDTTITIEDCDPDDKYTVKFSTNAKNTSESISGKYYITSYIS